MNNYQLYRTNVLLGGQMKWDLIVDTLNATLYVSDFHLSPISNNVSYIHKSDEYLLNNTHQDNVKSFYNEIRSDFYNEALEIEYTHDFPIIVNKNTHRTCYSNMYDCGCKRLSSYKLYNKQFEFLCPVWIEHLNDDLKFEIVVKGEDSNSVLSKNALTLKANGMSFHDKFVTYFKKYIQDISLDKGDDSLLNIQFKNSIACITGLNVENGLIHTKNINSIVENLSLTERPVMETDKLLTKSFADNLMISKQLFNFNLCFNADDILSGSITSMMAGKPICISVNVYIGDTLLEKRDFYTEYEYIKKDVYGDIDKNDNIDVNVYDYLHDYESVELMNKNKMCQSICHWSLADNNDYIFNLYDGFSGIYIHKDKNTKEISYHVNEHQHSNSPNLFINHADKSQNASGWISAMQINYWSEFYKFIINTDKMKTKCMHIYDKKYINNVKYSFIPKLGDDGFYLIGLYTTYDLLTAAIDARADFNLSMFAKISDTLYLFAKDNLIMLVTTDESALAFANVRDALYIHKAVNYINVEDKLAAIFMNIIYNMQMAVVEPAVISFTHALNWEVDHGPSIKTTEVIYNVNDEDDTYVVRYDGNIKPTFIDGYSKYNSLYYKDYISDDKENSKLLRSKYIGYLKSGFSPRYPSINYCAIHKIPNWDYETIPDVQVSEFSNTISVINDFEYKWFNRSHNIILTPEINLVQKNSKDENGNYKSVHQLAKEGISKLYNIKLESDALLEYLLSKYVITNNWEYYSISNVDDYKYFINLKLK
jgi:hypothetical protein